MDDLIPHQAIHSFETQRMPHLETQGSRRRGADPGNGLWPGVMLAPERQGSRG